MSGDSPEVGKGRGRGKPGKTKRLRKPTTETFLKLTQESDESSRSITPPTDTTSASLTAATTQNNFPKSNLNAEAKEFVPRGWTQPQYQSSGWDSYTVPADTSYNTWSTASPVDPIERVTTTLNDLSRHPGSFDPAVQSLNRDICQTIDSEETLEKIVDIIFNKSITDLQSTYTGARICAYFSQHLLPVGHIKLATFRQLLLKRCQREHTKRNELASSPNDCARLHGFTMFMGELFMNMTVNNERIHLLATACRDLTLTLLDHPSDDNYKYAIRLLKFAGAALEDTEKEKSGLAPHMDNIVQRIKQQTLDVQFISKTVKQMLLDLIELRASNWGRIDLTPSPKPESQMSQFSFSDNVALEPIFYDATGQVITREEAGYHDETNDFVPADDTTSITSSDFAVNPDGTFQIGTWSNPDDEQYAATAGQYIQSNEYDQDIDSEIQDAFEAFIVESQTQPPPYQ